MSKDSKKNDKRRLRAKDTLKDARKAYEKFAKASHKAVESTHIVLPEAAKDFNAKVLSYTDANISELFDFAKDIISSKSMDDALMIQNEYMQAQATRFHEQSVELGRSLKQAFTEVADEKE